MTCPENALLMYQAQKQQVRRFLQVFRNIHYIAKDRDPTRDNLAEIEKLSGELLEQETDEEFMKRVSGQGEVIAIEHGMIKCCAHGKYRPGECPQCNKHKR